MKSTKVVPDKDILQLLLRKLKQKRTFWKDLFKLVNKIRKLSIHYNKTHTYI